MRLRVIHNLVALAFLASCAGRHPAQVKTVQEIKKDNQLPRKLVIHPGKVYYLKLEVGDISPKAKLICQEKEIPYSLENGLLRAFVSETYFSSLKPFECRLKAPSLSLVLAKFEVKDYPYKQEHLKVDKRRVFLNQKDLERVKKEQLVLNEKYQETQLAPLFEEAFAIPLDSKVTSYYGTRRIYNNKKKGQHLGNDFRAKVGVPIPASNTGKVVIARELFYTGYTVILNHGLGIFSVYGHLSALKVNEGDYVPKGAIIGLSGATGRVSGPHLHWGVKIHGNWIDGISLSEVEL